MESLGELGIDIKIDWRKVNDSLNKVSTATKKASSSMTKAIGTAMRGITSVALSATKKVISIFTNAFSKIVIVIKRAMIVSGVAISGFLIYSTKMAIEVEETESLFEHSFGNMATSVRAWSDDYSKSIKTNKYDTIGFLSTMFNMTKSMGLTEDQAISTSKEIIKIANDLKSAYNLKGSVAFDKIRSGIAGESEPLKQLGILLDETTVKEYAFTNGIAKRGKVLTNQQKVLARLGALQEATAGIQGDMARTLGSTQNRIRALTDGFREFSVNMGKAVKSSDSFRRLLALVEQLAEKAKYAIADKLGRALQILDNHFGNESNRKKWLKFFNGVEKIIQVVTNVLKDFFEKVVKIGKSDVFIDKLKKSLESVKETLIEVWGIIKRLTASMKKWLGDEKKVGKLKNDFKNLKETLGPILIFFSAIAKALNWLIGLIVSFRKLMLKISGAKPGGFLDTVLIITLGGAILKVVKQIKSIKGLSQIFKMIATSFKLLASPKTLLMYWGNTLIPNIIKIFIKLKTVIMGGWKFTPFKGLTNIFTKLWGVFKSIFAGISSLWAGFVTSLGLVTTASASVVTALSAIAAIVGWLAGKGLVKLNDWLVTNVAWFGNLQQKLDNFWASVIDKIPLWKKLFGAQEYKLDDEKQHKLEQFRQMRANLGTTVPAPSSVSKAYGTAGISAGDKAMLEQLKIVAQEIRNQPQKQTQLDRVRV